ncbi:ricin-type beta-trefoil lectin domain protein [Streptomyces sp. NPDC102364]|uniref:ricin-type beta-trefoil lectin domain protein n=1 Tax=Streptomyces sp. NPDC102364 TaxID=3366161 RepID=UPI00380CE7D1
MTRSAHQPPTSAKADTGADGEETAEAVTAVASEPVSAREGPGAESPSESEPATTAAGVEVADPQSTNTGPGADPDSARESDDGVAAHGPGAETDADATAAAKSRLPALVRTMTATAIDKPGTTTTVGRPGKAVLAGAAVAGALLVSVPFLVLGGDKDDNDRKETTAAGTVLGGDETEDPGAFTESTATPGTGASKDDKKDSGEKGAAGHDDTSPSAERGKSTDEPKSGAAEKKEPAKKPEAEKKPSAGKNRPAKAGNVTFSAPMALRSHLAGRCLDVPAGDFTDGKKLMMWDCNNGPAQQWQFASDGTVRIHGLCLDVANADFTPGTPMQIARCSGNDAQKFVLNEAHDLVNTVVGKCVDIKGSNPDNKAPVQLWTCNGADAQKWSV